MKMDSQASSAAVWPVDRLGLLDARDPTALRVQVLRPALPDESSQTQRAVPWQLQARLVRPVAQHRIETKLLRERVSEWLTVNGTAEAAMRAALRARLVSQGLTPTLREEALACVAAKAQRSLGREASDAQLVAAWGLLEGHLVDMAHAEGKSLTVALAAGAVALAGESVHVFVATDFLASRDARLHAPLFVALGLRVGMVTALSTPSQRQAAYAADVVYSVAAELARDYLRDCHALARNSAVQTADRVQVNRPTTWFPRGLSCALVDDADQTLLDEATMPLDLVEVHDDPDLHAACIVALALARRVRPDVDVVVDVADFSVQWTDVGEARVELLSKPLGAAWLNRSDRRDLISQALVALHALHADHDYGVRDGRVSLRLPKGAPDADQPEWPRTLQTLLEVKEGCRPSPVLRTVACTRLQRFFPVYKHLAGTGLLDPETAQELTHLYGLRCMSAPRQWPGSVQEMPSQVFEAACMREAAAVQRVKSLQKEQRAVLVGVAGHDAALAISAALQAAAVEHTLVDGRDETSDALSIERAGQAGAVTILVDGAARGMSTPVAPELVALGGLHVLDLLDTPSQRVRKRFLGRAAVRGTPGTAETWHAADMPCWDRSWIDLPSSGSPQWMIEAACRLQQLNHRWSSRRKRRRLLAQR